MYKFGYVRPTPEANENFGETAYGANFNTGNLESNNSELALEPMPQQSSYLPPIESVAVLSMRK